jgi:malate permease and related proteins
LSTFLYILTNIILPIFLLVAIGFVAQKKLKMDTRTISRLNIYIFIPAVLFMKIYEAKVSLSFVGTVVVYILAIQIFMMLLGEVLSRIYKYPRSTKKAFSNTLLFFNSGNFGLPLIDLVFKGSVLATASQIFIMLTQNITTSTFGVFQASSGKSSYKKALMNILVMPSIYVLAAVVLVKTSGFIIPEPVLSPLRYLSTGFIGFALLTLGVQLAEVTAKINIKAVLLSSSIRLLVSPALGFLLILLLGVHGELAKAMIIGVATPTAVNTAILAREFDNEPEYAAQNVLVSTLLSPITLSILIFILNRYM